MKNKSDFRSLNCNGCQCDNCYECSSCNCEICYRAEFATEDCNDMYHVVENGKECDFD